MVVADQLVQNVVDVGVVADADTVQNLRKLPKLVHYICRFHCSNR